MNTKRTAEQYKNLRRAFWQNHLRAEASKRKDVDKLKFPNAFYRPTDFLQSNFWFWIYHYLKSRLGAKHDYPVYPFNGNLTGVYQIDNSCTLAASADWAADTNDADLIAVRMRGNEHDFTIHLGDTYYVGSYDEIDRNFTGKGAAWRIGKKGSFALLGNHEMYARGIPYFDKLLPALGLKDVNTSKCIGQHAGYFCLDTKYWRILGIDTGYNSIGRIPIIELLPWFKPDCKLEDKLIEWLKKYVKLDDPADKRGILILSHHQYITAFKSEDEYLRPAEQLADLIGTERDVIWLWGHEHRFAVYGKISTAKGIRAYGRCIGNGGLPIELNNRLDEGKDGFHNLVAFDNRERIHIDDEDIGFNGYVILTLKNETLKIEYFDSKEKTIEEEWSVDNTGRIKGKIESMSNVKLTFGKDKNINDAVS